METGGDRAMFDSAFGQSVEDKLAEPTSARRRCSENRAEVLALGHALETVKTITGDDVEAIIEGTPGPTVDGRPYHDSGFAQMLERYHEAVPGAQGPRRGRVAHPRAGAAAADRGVLRRGQRAGGAAAAGAGAALALPTRRRIAPTHPTVSSAPCACTTR